MEYTYLLVNFFTILIPFLFSFHPKLNFHKTWSAFFPAVILVGAIFVLWDMYFTHNGIWGFNPDYITGAEIFNLPLEEVLFFFCIPYACVFTFHSLDLIFRDRFNGRWKNAFSTLLVLFLFFGGLLNYGKWYTASTFLSLAMVLVVFQFILKIDWLGEFYVVYAILLVPFFLVNGVLTGSGIEEPVVWYNESHFMGIRLGTIPLEDVFYGLELILLNVWLYKYFLDRKKLQAVETP